MRKAPNHRKNIDKAGTVAKRMISLVGKAFDPGDSEPVPSACVGSEQQDAGCLRDLDGDAKPFAALLFNGLVLLLNHQQIFRRRAFTICSVAMRSLQVMPKIWSNWTRSTWQDSASVGRWLRSVSYGRAPVMVTGRLTRQRQDHAALRCRGHPGGGACAAINRIRIRDSFA